MRSSASVQSGNLFGIETRRREPKKADPAPPGAVQKLIGIYRHGYERKFGEPPVVQKSDGSLLRSLVQQFGPLKVEQRLSAFMNWDDQFVIDSGFSIRVFYTRWNALAARCVQEQPAAQSRVMDADTTDAYLRKLKSAR